MGERLDIKKMKKIAHDIIAEESRNNNINVNVFPLTFVEYYKGFEEREGRKFKLYDALIYVGCRGYYEVGKGNFYVCLENFDYILKLDSYFKLAMTVYHEYRHRMQDDFDEYSYGGFLRDIDIYTKNFVDYFMLNHDSYSFEIGANMWAVSKAKEYLKRKYPELYEKEKSSIDCVEQRYIIDYLSYDANDAVLRCIKKIQQFRLKKAKEENLNIEDIDVNISGISPVLDIFIDGKGKFKEVKEIINNEKFKGLDKRIVSAIFSCRIFLDELDMDNLSLEELEVVSNALEYTNNVYKNQINSLDKFKPLSKDLIIKNLKSKKSFVGKLSVLAKYSNKLLFKILKNTEKKLRKNTAIGKGIRDDDEQLENMQLVSQKLEQGKRLVRQKSNHGFFISDMFYIIGILFSLLTILYLIIN